MLRGGWFQKGRSLVYPSCFTLYGALPIVRNVQQSLTLTVRESPRLRVVGAISRSGYPLIRSAQLAQFESSRWLFGAF